MVGCKGVDWAHEMAGVTLDYCLWRFEYFWRTERMD